MQKCKCGSTEVIVKDRTGTWCADCWIENNWLLKGIKDGFHRRRARKPNV